MTAVARVDLEKAALAFVRRWWRPAIQVGIGGALITNGVIVPILTRSFPDLTGLAAVIVAAAPFAGIRAWEKHKGLTAP